MKHEKLHGLVAATPTPFLADGSVNIDIIPQLTDHLLSQGVSGLYVCGSTGEGMSLTTDERRSVAEAFTKASAGRVPVIVQVGHNSLSEARRLAEHAQSIDADVVSATCPSYFKVADTAGLIECMSQIASGAPDSPFYYYHIPSLTGSAIDIAEFMHAGDSIPNMVGLKYTDTKLFEYQTCLDLKEGRYDVVWGSDEMMLGALATGATAAIGSTYNIAAPLYTHIMNAFNAGDMIEARRLQSLSVGMVRIMCRFPFHAAMKAILAMQGLDVGGCRPPLGKISATETKTLREELTAIGFFDWSRV